MGDGLAVEDRGEGFVAFVCEEDVVGVEFWDLFLRETSRMRWSCRSRLVSGGIWHRRCFGGWEEVVVGID